MLFLWDYSCPVKIQSCISLFFSFSLKIEYYFIFFPLFQPLIVNVITVNFLMEQLLKIAQLVSNLACSSVFKFMRKKSVFSIFFQFQFSIFQIITSFIPQFSKLTDIVHLTVLQLNKYNLVYGQNHNFTKYSCNFFYIRASMLSILLKFHNAIGFSLKMQV